MRKADLSKSPYHKEVSRSLPSGSVARRPAVRASRYDIKSELARGGMGVVYRAFDRVVGREVAYKRLLVADNASRARAMALFQREYTTLAQLAHPAIIEVYEYGSDEHGPYYTMELLSGEDLFAAAPMNIGEACRVLRDVASALALIHARKLLHRDISPSNVRLTLDGRAKLLDFGALTSFGVPPDLVGTPAFMAPEMLSREPLDQRADLYSLGALAYWTLTRRTAVRVRDLDGLRAAWALPIERPSAFVSLPKPLEELVLWLLNKDPAARPASAAEVIERLTAIADLPPEAEEQKVAYSYLAHPPLVGREDVLSRCDAAIARVAERKGGVLMLEAERGAGRSALLDHLARAAQLSGATVLRADASADASAFGLARALTRLGLALHPDLQDDARARDTQFAQLLNPQSGGRAESAWSPLEASQRQARTLSLMEKLLLDASTRNSMVILIDELQCADSESLALIVSLAAEASQRPLLLVLSTSSAPSDPDAYRKLARAAERLELPRLSEADTHELVNSVFGGVANSHRLARWLYEQSGGSPALTMDLARLLLARGLIRYTRGTFTLPHDVGEDVLEHALHGPLLARLVDLSEHAKQVARVLAISELPLELALITDALALETRTTVLAVEELQARGLAIVAEEQISMASVAVRDALSASLGEDVLKPLHLRLARALLARGDVSGEQRMQVGVHLLKAGEELEAAELLTRRGEGDWLSGKTPIPLLEQVLAILRRQGRTDEQCLTTLVPLVRGGFFGDMRAQRRHLDRTLSALSNVCGVTTAMRLTPRLGAKLALLVGVLWAVIRYAFTPEKYRFGSFKDTFTALLSILSATTAAAASAFDSEDAFHLARRFEALRAFGPDSAPYLGLEFCLATAEVGGGRFGDSIERYSRLLARFERPVKGMDPEVHLQFRLGILHGLAQAKAVDAQPEALVLADELERTRDFFAPHAEVIRASYFGQRGELEESNRHKQRGELLALRGGISWSSVTVMTMRALYMAMTANDLVAIVQILPELERLSEIAPKMLLFRDIGAAFLENAHGRAERAVAAYEKVFASPDARFMPTHSVDQLAYARALAAAGRKEEALRLAESVDAAMPANEMVGYRRYAQQTIANIELELGLFARARARHEGVLELIAPCDSPCWFGLAHRDLARVALLEHDEEAYARHADRMAAYLTPTRHPALIREIEQLRNEAEALRAPSPSGLSTMDDGLDDLSTAFETSDERLAQLTGQRAIAQDGERGSEQPRKSS